MSFEPTPKQALFLWKMICAEDPREREPKKSEAKPKLDANKERAPLLAAGFLETERRGRAEHLLLTDRAWDWASRTRNVSLMRSNSKEGAVALEGLLHRLIPFLERESFTLADLFVDDSEQPPGGKAVRAADPTDDAGVGAGAPGVAEGDSGAQRHAGAPDITPTVARLAAMSSTGRVELLALRRALGGNPSRWEAAKRSILGLLESGQVELLKEDNNAAVTAEVQAAAIPVSGEPRHILYWRERA